MFTPDDVHLERVLGEINTLAEFGRNPSGGITRYTFSTAHQDAYTAVANWMHDAGFTVFFDKWGNLHGRTSDDDTPAVMSGSHVDSVPNGGNYDGPLGVLSALEAVRMIRERGVVHTKPLEVVSFIEEEGARFLGLMGSSLLTGTLPDVEAITDRDGVRYVDALTQVEFPYSVRQDYALNVASYVELHIEQGRRLEDAGIPLGVVTAVASPNFMVFNFIGRSDHAGATAYADRHDTLLAAGEIIVAVREMGQSRFDGRGHMTVGRVVPKPNVANVVAGFTELSVDFRAVDDATADEMRSAILSLIRATCDRYDLTYEMRSDQHVPAAPAPRYIQTAIRDGADSAGVAHMPIVSWAAHDAMRLATVCDAGMIFTSCKDGRSHTPEEFTAPDDIAAGIATLANTLITLANT